MTQEEAEQVVQELHRVKDPLAIEVSTAEVAEALHVPESEIIETLERIRLDRLRSQDTEKKLKGRNREAMVWGATFVGGLLIASMIAAAVFLLKAPSNGAIEAAPSVSMTAAEPAVATGTTTSASMAPAPVAASAASAEAVPTATVGPRSRS